MSAASGGDAAFGARLVAAVAAHGPLCAGIDPHPALLAEWGLTDDADGLDRFVDDLRRGAGRAGGAWSSRSRRSSSGTARAGIAVLERLLAGFAGSGTLTLLDVKRGDIGSTMDGYADAYLAVGAPLGADAVTLSPYLGFGSLEPGAGRGGRRRPRGVRAGPHLQPGGRRGPAGHAVAGRSVAQGDRRRRRGAQRGRRPARRGRRRDRGDPRPRPRPVRAATARCSPPGIGAQGAGPADIAARFCGLDGLVVPAASRSLLAAGPDPAALRAAAHALRDDLATTGLTDPVTRPGSRRGVGSVRASRRRGRRRGR